MCLRFGRDEDSKAGVTSGWADEMRGSAPIGFAEGQNDNQKLCVGYAVSGEKRISTG